MGIVISTTSGPVAIPRKLPRTPQGIAAWNEECRITLTTRLEPVFVTVTGRFVSPVLPGPDMHDPRLLVDCIGSGAPDIGATRRCYSVPADLPWRQRLWIRIVIALVGG